MNELTAPVIRFRHAAEAIGVTKKTLRNWLVRSQVELDAPSEGWSVFSRLDLIRLALTAELVRYGIGVLPAFMTARTQVDYSTDLLASYRNTPAAVLQHAFKDFHCFIEKSADQKFRWALGKPGQPIPDDFEEPSILIIQMEALVEKVTERLAAALADETDDEDRSDDE